MARPLQVAHGGISKQPLCQLWSPRRPYCRWKRQGHLAGCNCTSSSHKRSNQTFICGGGDWFEHPLQTSAFKLLNCPPCCIILGEIFFDGKCCLQDEFSTLKRGLGHHGLGPRGPRNRTLPSRHAAALWGILSNTW
jgi:hypothetical protein